MAHLKLNNVSVNFNSIKSKRKLFPSIISKKNDITPLPFSLKNINLDLKSGDKIGLIGRNGAGKTTLLRVIAKILKPTNGEILTVGSVGSLFGPIPFLNPMNSAFENIKTFSMLNELNRSEFEAVEHDVKTFIEIGDHYNKPVYTFSAGMLARFNFALLTAIRRDILVMDEEIGAGDIFFRQKIENRLKKLYENAEIIVIASHSNSLIKQLCNQAILLENGTINFKGQVDECLSLYQSYL
tara:strand:- start:2375 stop:3094 length:720 start_codon:yes stop_codon:yes gene_type:complete